MGPSSAREGNWHFTRGRSNATSGTLSHEEAQNCWPDWGSDGPVRGNVSRRCRSYDRFEPFAAKLMVCSAYGQRAVIGVTRAFLVGQRSDRSEIGQCFYTKARTFTLTNIRDSIPNKRRAKQTIHGNRGDQLPLSFYALELSCPRFACSAWNQILRCCAEFRDATN